MQAPDIHEPQMNLVVVTYVLHPSQACWKAPDQFPISNNWTFCWLLQTRHSEQKYIFEFKLFTSKASHTAVYKKCIYWFQFILAGTTAGFIWLCVSSACSNCTWHWQIANITSSYMYGYHGRNMTNEVKKDSSMLLVKFINI